MKISVVLSCFGYKTNCTHRGQKVRTPALPDGDERPSPPYRPMSCPQAERLEWAFQAV